MKNSVMREKLAEYAHRAWSGWMVYMLAESIINPDGSITIPARLADRWRRQAAMRYAQLPEDEKVSDRAEADTMLAIMEEE